MQLQRGYAAPSQVILWSERAQRVRGIALQRDATTTRRSRVAKHVSFHSRGSANGCAKTTGIARSAMQLQRGYAAPSQVILWSERAQRVRGIALQRDATTTRRSRVAKHVSFHSRGSANGCAKTTGIARSAMQLQRGYAAPSLQIL